MAHFLINLPWESCIMAVTRAYFNYIFLHFHSIIGCRCYKLRNQSSIYLKNITWNSLTQPDQHEKIMFTLPSSCHSLVKVFRANWGCGKDNGPTLRSALLLITIFQCYTCYRKHGECMCVSQTESLSTTQMKSYEINQRTWLKKLHARTLNQLRRQIE